MTILRSEEQSSGQGQNILTEPPGGLTCILCNIKLQPLRVDDRTLKTVCPKCKNVNIFHAPLQLIALPPGIPTQVMVFDVRVIGSLVRSLLVSCRGTNKEAELAKIVKGIIATYGISSKDNT